MLFEVVILAPDGQSTCFYNFKYILPPSVVNFRVDKPDIRLNLVVLSYPPSAIGFLATGAWISNTVSKTTIDSVNLASLSSS